MAVSKRTRYEVLRRDEFTCRYCGASAPDAKLTVDHVTPVALGGADDPANLVAACRDCNAGKGSASPDESLVADVRDDALRYAEMTRQAYAVLRQRLSEREDYVWEFQQTYKCAEMPRDWQNTIERWFEMGYPLELLLDAARKAERKDKWFAGTERFTYLCGIVWKQIRMIGEMVEAKRDIEGRFWTEDALTEERIEAYTMGRNSGWNDACGAVRCIDALSLVVDRGVA